MGRPQSSVLISWRVSMAATIDEPCDVCGEWISSRRRPVTPRDAEIRKLERGPLEVMLMKVVVLPKDAIDRTAVRAGRVFVIPVLRDDMFTDILEDASSFPLPHSSRRVIYSGWVRIMKVCAPCYSVMRRNLESANMLDENYVPHRRARILRRNQLLDEGRIDDRDQRGYVERREGPLDRRRGDRRSFNPLRPKVIRPIETKEEE
jgi:hypothetical protein